MKFLFRHTKLISFSLVIIKSSMLGRYYSKVALLSKSKIQSQATQLYCIWAHAVCISFVKFTNYLIFDGSIILI